ncbi:helix-turn-helix domain-containing protein [Gracilibacillus caseinilyticus]|uniref:Helix-turn-helix domain-containing protein n=1 Tax=Gracilibacillus caseinilyticus TaxID=2932256 RepID=A0ABY4EQX7_9BACI|nr:helix-turn-helix domain-containing protein [Gracilibacillus caseinilyticus]UOQ46624.1 helix-turn-helix domain-containing protein [Gracilibacillus caseinilyticus]
MAQKVNVSLRNQSFYLDYSGPHKAVKDMQHFHLHQDYEIFYMLEGEKLFLMDGEQFIAEKDQIVFIDKNRLHKTLVTDRNYQRIVINFRDSFLLKEDHYLLQALFNKGALLLNVHNASVFRLLLENMVKEYYLDNRDRKRYLQLLLTQFLIESERLLHIQPQPQDKLRPHSQQHETVDAIITYINEHFAEDITLSVLAEAFFLHEQSISKLFKQTIGYRFTDYLNAVRISNAKQLLMETSIKINQITKKVGYTNHVHFWRIFKKMTGMSPNEFREEHQMKCKRLTEKA